MLNHTTSTTPRRTRRFSGISESFEVLRTNSSKKRKITPENESQRTEANPETELIKSRKKSRLPSRLSNDLVPHFQIQKKAVLFALKNPNFSKSYFSSDTKAIEQLEELVHGTVDRQEGNSCLILGARGSGKTKLVEHTLSFSRGMIHPPIILRLSGHSQTNDSLAMREILRQIREQSGIDVRMEDEDGSQYEASQEIDLSLPSSSRLPQLIGALPNLGRPVIVLLDAFDKFTEHPRQALLYCLLDTVQSCRGELARNHDENQLEFSDMAQETSERVKAQSPGKEHGLLVIGITSRIDCLTLLEKRVKSRFSHRVLTLTTCNGIMDMLEFFANILTTDPGVDYMLPERWQSAWSTSIQEFFSNPEVQDIFKEVYMFSKDVRFFIRLLLSSVAALTPDSPWLTLNLLREKVAIQRSPLQFPFLQDLTYPHHSLLIAAIHTFTSGQETFTFEVLYDKFITQIRLNASAAVSSERGDINVPLISRKVLLGVFENLVDNGVFYPAIPRASHISKAFMKYYCRVSREDVKNLVDETEHPGLKKWFYKSY